MNPTEVNFFKAARKFKKNNLRSNSLGSGAGQQGSYF